MLERRSVHVSTVHMQVPCVCVEQRLDVESMTIDDSAIDVKEVVIADDWIVDGWIVDGGIGGGLELKGGGWS